MVLIPVALLSKVRVIRQGQSNQVVPDWTKVGRFLRVCLVLHHLPASNILVISQGVWHPVEATLYGISNLEYQLFLTFRRLQPPNPWKGLDLH